MLTLKLSRGYEAIIDDEDADLSELKWSYVQCRKVGYAFRKGIVDGRQTSIYLHRVIASRVFGEIPPGIKVDHKNRISLDNRRNNLRLATHRQNLANRGPSDSLDYKGVFRLKDGWHARINIGGINKQSIGYKYPWEAAVQYDQWARETFGEFAWENYPDGRKPDQYLDEYSGPDPRKIWTNFLRASRGG